MNDRFKLKIAVFERFHTDEWEFTRFIENSDKFGVSTNGNVIHENVQGFITHLPREKTPQNVCVTMEAIQCTGLKDKNGKLIYEGDILLYPDLEEYLKTRKYAPKEQKIIIEYIGYRLMSYVPIMDEYQDLEGWTNGEDNNTPLEVIGNIYENKELLEECE